MEWKKYIIPVLLALLVYGPLLIFYIFGYLAPNIKTGTMFAQVFLSALFVFFISLVCGGLNTWAIARFGREVNHKTILISTVLFFFASSFWYMIFFGFAIMNSVAMLK